MSNKTPKIMARKLSKRERIKVRITSELRRFIIAMDERIEDEAFDDIYDSVLDNLLSIAIEDARKLEARVRHLEATRYSLDDIKRSIRVDGKLLFAE